MSSWISRLLAVGGMVASSCSPCAAQFTFAFFDDFYAQDPWMWEIADGWANGGVENKTGWRQDYVVFQNGYMEIYLDQHGCGLPGGCSGQYYAGGEYRSMSEYGYGAYQVRMKAAKGCGLVTSFFIYDEDERDEIDIEILGKDTWYMQVNYWDNGVRLKSPPMISLGFDAAADWHDYRIEWSSTSIKWYVRNKPTDPLQLVHTETGTSLGNFSTPQALKLPSNAGKVMMNLWAGCTNWNGCMFFGSPQCFPDDHRARASYDWVVLQPD